MCWSSHSRIMSHGIIIVLMFSLFTVICELSFMFKCWFSDTLHLGGRRSAANQQLVLVLCYHFTRVC